MKVIRTGIGFRTLALLVSAAAGALLVLPAAAGEFRRLNGEQIRARVVGRDITDDFHWSEYFRRDGVLVVVDMARPSTGRWKIERNMLCLSRRPGEAFDCFQVWVSGEEVSLRVHEAEQPHTAYIRPHQ